MGLALLNAALTNLPELRELGYVPCSCSDVGRTLIC